MSTSIEGYIATLRVLKDPDFQICDDCTNASDQMGTAPCGTTRCPLENEEG